MKNATPNFLLTRWSLIADSTDPARSRQALETLCNDYWYPVYAAIRRAGYSHADAEDLTQGFFASALEKSTFARADPQRGRFRTFILSCLGNFLHHARIHDHAQKRDSRKLIAFESMDAEERYAAEPVDDLTPDRLFERTLAKEFLRQAEAELEAERRHDGKLALFAALRPHLYAGDSEQAHIELAAELNMSLEALKSHLTRTRKRFREILRSRAEQIVSDSDDGRDELRALQNAL